MVAPSANRFDLDFSSFDPTPQATQDTDLLRQLNFIPGLREILMLRQVHALEHATVWVLSQNTARYSSHHLLGGLSTERGFYLYGQVSASDLHHATSAALQRITLGEWNLAVHPRCGTNLSVGILVTTGLAVGVHLLLPKGPLEQLFGLSAAAIVAMQVTPGIGHLAQQYVTTAIPFNLIIENITPIRDPIGRPAHFVSLRWIE
jgi:hypothetical protein